MPWRFSDFFDRYNEWIDQNDPEEAHRFWVLVWIYGLEEDPRARATPAEGFGEPWWFAQIPNTEDRTHAVASLYSIEGDHVRCSAITTLRKPIF